MFPGRTTGLKASPSQEGFSSALTRLLVYLSLSTVYFTEVFFSFLFTTPHRLSYLASHYHTTILHTSKEVALQALWKLEDKDLFLLLAQFQHHKRNASVRSVRRFSELLNPTQTSSFSYCSSLELTKRYMPLCCRFNPGPKEMTFILELKTS